MKKKPFPDPLRAAYFTVFVVILASSRFFAYSALPTFDEYGRDFAVEIQATVTIGPPANVKLDWKPPIIIDQYRRAYTVYRKDSNGAWQRLSPATPISETTWTDSAVATGNAYEYKIHNDAGDTWTDAHVNAYGYAFVGLRAPLVKDTLDDRRGKLILIVDNKFTLPNPLRRLEEDLVGDGWEVLRHDVSRSEQPTTIREIIRTHYNTYKTFPDRQQVKVVFLFGHIPVPYSGDFSWDGHTSIPDADNHTGAWPCDAYYGEMDLSDQDWADCLRDVDSTFPSNRNAPGDGKFDANYFPSTLELRVGRVDMYGLEQIVDLGIPEDQEEQELLRRYLNKNNQYRHKIWVAERRALLGDGFGDGAFDEISGRSEAYGASGYRLFAPFFGFDSIVLAKSDHSLSIPAADRWISKLRAWAPGTTRPYLWTYGCGPGDASHTHGWLGTHPYNDEHRLFAQDLVTPSTPNNLDLKAVFFSFFGSYAGDWDRPNNVMRAILASERYALACSASGRPHHYFHHMGLGATIGDGILLSQNNDGSANGYENDRNLYPRSVPIALMGDPTLRLHTVRPPRNLRQVSASQQGYERIAWDDPLATEETTAHIDGYHVYRSENPRGPFTRLTLNNPTTLRYFETPIISGNRTYMIRTVKRENPSTGITYSGTYTNMSQGMFFHLPAEPPIVSVVSTVAYGREATPNQTCSFTVSRSIVSASQLAVSYTVSGSANPGDPSNPDADYQTLPGMVTILGNQASAPVTVTILDDSDYEDNETVTIKLTPISTYKVGPRSQATVTINSLATFTPVDDDDSASVRGLNNSETSVGLSTIGRINDYPYHAVRWDLPPAGQSWLRVKPVVIPTPLTFFHAYATAIGASKIVGPGWLNGTYENVGFYTESQTTGELPALNGRISTAYGINANALNPRSVGASEAGPFQASYWDFPAGSPVVHALVAPDNLPWSWALGINDPAPTHPDQFPHIVGHGQDSSFVTLVLPLVWPKNLSPGAILPMPAPGGYDQGTARDVNDNGRIVGWVWNSSSGVIRAARWDYDGSSYQPAILPVPSGDAGIATYAVRVNAAGNAVGYAYDPVNGYRAVLWKNNGQVCFLNQCLLPSSTLNFFVAYDINDSEQITGELIDGVDGCSSKGFLLSP